MPSISFFSTGIGPSGRWTDRARPESEVTLSSPTSHQWRHFIPCQRDGIRSALDDAPPANHAIFLVPDHGFLVLFVVSEYILRTGLDARSASITKVVVNILYSHAHLLGQLLLQFVPEEDVIPLENDWDIFRCKPSPCRATTAEGWEVWMERLLRSHS